MGALIRAAIPVAASAGAPALEAYPVDTAVEGHTRNLFPGVASAFAKQDFQVVARHKPDRPVMRKTLTASAISGASAASHDGRRQHPPSRAHAVATALSSA
jgi:hypothetical protein